MSCVFLMEVDPVGMFRPQKFTACHVVQSGTVQYLGGASRIVQWKIMVLQSVCNNVYESRGSPSAFVIYLHCS